MAAASASGFSDRRKALLTAQPGIARSLGSKSPAAQSQPTNTERRVAARASY
jgi:hypothetical protein